MPLSDTTCRNAKPQEKPYKLFDEKGLYLEVMPAGSRGWRQKYRFAGKEKRLSHGAYPEVPLKLARERRDEARKLLATGVDPSLHRQLEKARRIEAAANSFEAITREWFAKFSTGWAASHSDKIIRRFERDIFPLIGTRPVAEIAAPELLMVLRRIESRGTLDTAHRAHQNCGQVFRYAVATGRALRDPSADLRGALPPVKQGHFASITDPAEVGHLLRTIQGYSGGLVTQCALQLAPYVFVRPGELRNAEWTEFNLNAAEWRIPAGKMKMKALHIVPLSQQALAILERLRPATGSGPYVFPGVRANRRPMSENTVNAALRALGYSGEQMTGHGFRSMASTLLNEQGWPRDAIERQLAHGERNRVRAAYNYAEHLPERRKMMQAWADYLDALRDGRRVVAGTFGRVA